MSPEKIQPPVPEVEAPENAQLKKDKLIEDAYNDLAGRLSRAPGIEFGEPEQAILKLKLGRYFQREENIDLNTLFDALIETPNFLKTEKGGLHRLLKIHEQKTLQKIAEIRKERANLTGDEESNPYKRLFTTASGKFYLTRLFNMQHLREESEYMNHCVGTSDSYVNKMKRGEVEIFSLRTVPAFNEETQKWEGDKPVLTIEYDVKNKKIIQMKKANDELIGAADIADLDIFDLLKQASATFDDAGQARDFTRIAPGELTDIKVSDYHVLTKNGEVHYRDFDTQSGEVVLKAGEMPTEGLPKIDVAKIVNIITGIKVQPAEIAQAEDEMADNTKIYLGPLYPNFFKTIPDTVEHIYTALSEREIRLEDTTIGGKSIEQLKKEFSKPGFSDNSGLMREGVFVIGKKTEVITTVRLTVRDLGFPNGATTNQIFDKITELGLEKCPAEVGPRYCLQHADQLTEEFVEVGMEPISGPGGHPLIFSVERSADGSGLDSRLAGPDFHWDADGQVLFRFRK